MRWLTALFLTAFGVVPLSSRAQESIQDWSKKVVELQEKEGQNFEQDLQLAKGFLYLQRRPEALALLNQLKAAHPKDQRVLELFETASTQFFFQESAESYSDAVQLIQGEVWTEAKEKIDNAIQKESRHRMLVLREIQLELVLGQTDMISETLKIAENTYPESVEWKVFNAWINLNKNESKEAYRIFSALWASDRKLFEKSEAVALGFCQSSEQSKHALEWNQLSKIARLHPEWVGLRVWTLKKQSFFTERPKKEVAQLKDLFSDFKKLKDSREKQEKENANFYIGMVSTEKAKTAFDQLLAEDASKDASKDLVK